MYILNKIVGGILNPVMIALILTLAGIVCVWFRRRRSAIGILALAFMWTWVWGTGLWASFVGGSLERLYPPQLAENMPKADVIVLLGGGMTENAEASPYPDMSEGGDRVWHAARLYHAGKAPLIVPTGGNDFASTVPFLEALGVPRSAIKVENDARNTEENARYVASMLKGQSGAKVLLVTSAMHMRRALLMYKRYAPTLEVIPAATDHCVEICTDHPLKCADFFPNTDFYHKTGAAMKEHVGYWGYRFLRR